MQWFKVSIAQYVKHWVTWWHSNSTPQYKSKRDENICPHKNSHSSTQRNLFCLWAYPLIAETVQKNLKLKQHRCSLQPVNGYIKCEYSCNGMLWKKWITDSRPISSKGLCIVHLHPPKRPKKLNTFRGRLVVLRVGQLEEWREKEMDMGFLLSDENVLNFMIVMITQLQKYWEIYSKIKKKNKKNPKKKPLNFVFLK